MSGVSEDEQSALALALALGYNLKYHLKLTAFESQPNTFGQVDKQDYARYNTAAALAKDVLMLYEKRNLKEVAMKKVALVVLTVACLFLIAENAFAQGVSQPGDEKLQLRLEDLLGFRRNPVAGTPLFTKFNST